MTREEFSAMWRRYLPQDTWRQFDFDLWMLTQDEQQRARAQERPS